LFLNQGIGVEGEKHSQLPNSQTSGTALCLTRSLKAEKQRLKAAANKYFAKCFLVTR